MTDATAIILAGGRSRRMGSDKAAARLDGRTMLNWVIEACRELRARVVVVAAPGQELEDLPRNAEVVRDEVAGRGPLAGILTGMAAVEAEGGATLLLACDHPLVRAPLLRLLLASLDEHSAVVPVADGRTQPLCAAVSLRALPLLRAAFEDGTRAASVLVDLPGARLLPITEWRGADPDELSFFGVNTPDQLARAEAIVRWLYEPN